MKKSDTFDDLWIQLNSPDSIKAMEARIELISKGQEITAKLLSLVDSGTVKQIANAVIVMGEIGDTAYEAKLCELLKHHENIMVRLNAAKMLGYFKSEEAINALEQKLDHDSEMVGMWITTSLGKIGGARVKQILQNYLGKSPSHTMCYMTIRALGESGDKDLVPIITPYLNHEKNHVRTDAKLALEKINAS